MVKGQGIDAIMNISVKFSVSPVSYTHLDVYKRQDQYIGLNARWHMKKIPIIRGVLSFIDSLVLGMSTLTYSASFFEDEEEAEKAKEKDSKSDAVFMGLTVALSVVIAVVLFMLTPFFISSLFGKVIKSPMTLAVIEEMCIRDRLWICSVRINSVSERSWSAC